MKPLLNSKMLYFLQVFTNCPTQKSCISWCYEFLPAEAVACTLPGGSSSYAFPWLWHYRTWWSTGNTADFHAGLEQHRRNNVNLSSAASSLWNSWSCDHRGLQDWTGGAGGPFNAIGLYGSAGFAGGASGGGSGNPRPITISSMFKISESIVIERYWFPSIGTHTLIVIFTRGGRKVRLCTRWKWQQVVSQRENNCLYGIGISHVQQMKP